MIEEPDSLGIIYTVENTRTLAFVNNISITIRTFQLLHGRYSLCQKA